MFVATHAPLALLSLVTMAICLLLARYAWRQHTIAGAFEFGWLMIAVAWMSLTSAVDYLLSTQALPAKILASQLYVIGGASASLLLFLFAVRYTHNDRWLTRGWLLLLWTGVAARIMMALTNPWHHLYWVAVEPASTDPAAPLVFTYSALNRSASVFTYGLMVLGGFFLIRSALRSPVIYRSQGAILSLALAFPLLANLVYYLDLGAWSRIDYTPIAYGISSLLLAWAVFRFQFLDLAPIAQDALFANLSDGVMAINAHRVIVAANPTAQRLLNTDEPRLLGARATDMHSPWGSVFAAALDAGPPRQEVEVSGQSISVACTPLIGRGQQHIGHILMLHDVTAHRKLQSELVCLNSELEQRVAMRTAELEQTVRQLQTEIDERQRAEVALREMQESLADHIADLSHQLSVLYGVILLGGRSLDLGAVRQLTLETIIKVLHADAGFIFTYPNGSQHFEIASQQGFSGEEIAQVAAVAPAWILDDPIPHTILHLRNADESVPVAVRVVGMEACILAGLYRMGTPVGALGVYWHETPSLSVERIALFRALGDQLAILAENVRLRNEREQALVQEERKRIARDLHDSVTQSLYALTLSADTAVVRLENGRTEGLSPLLDRIATAASQALREIRLLLYELHLATPDAMPLADALQLRIDAVEKRAGICATLEIDDALTVSPAIAQTLYWIAVEALNNSLKHAAAEHVAVRITRNNGVLELSVTDDGAGLTTQPGTHGGFGLRGMADRAAQFGGEVSLFTLPTGGARVVAYIPLKAEVGGSDKMVEAEI